MIGVDNNYSPVGVGEHYHYDSADVQQKLERYCVPRPLLDYGEFTISSNEAKRRFALLYIRESSELTVAKIDGQYLDAKGETQRVFNKNDVFIRAGSRTEKASDHDYRLITRRKRLDNAPTSENLAIEEPKPTAPQNIPQAEYQEFVGREHDIDEVILKLRGRAFLVSIDGVGGVGKTALAHQVATKCWHEKLFDAIVWVSAKTRRLLLTGIGDLIPSLTSYDDLMNHIARVLGYPRLAELRSDEKEKAIKQLLSQSNCLLVVDNLETVHDRKIYEFLQDLPAPTKALVTSRKRLSDVGVVRLEEMSFEETAELIRLDADFKDARALKLADEKTLRKIHDATGGIPLAIRWAVGWVALGDSIDHMLKRLGRGTDPILEFCFEETYNTMLTTDAKNLLSIMPVFNEEPNREQLSPASMLKGDTLDDAIIQLIMLSLINEKTREEADGTSITTYGILPLTLSYAQARLAENRGLEKDARKRLGEYLQLHKTIEEASVQYGYALEDLGATTASGRAAALLANLAFAAYQRGNYPGAVRLFKRAVETNSRLSYVYQVWAMVERQEANYGRADELFAEANRLNPTNSVILRAWARMKAESGAIEEARKLAQKGVEVNPEDRASLHNLAVSESQAGNYEKADELLDRSLFATPVDPHQGRQNVMSYGAKGENFRKWGVSKMKEANLSEAREKLIMGLDAVSNGLNIAGHEWKLREIQVQLFLKIGEVELRSGDLPRSEKYLRKAFFAAPRKPWEFKHNSKVCLALVKCLKEIGLTEEAIKFCKEGLRAWPGNEDLRAFCQRLTGKR